MTVQIILILYSNRVSSKLQHKMPNVRRIAQIIQLQPGAVEAYKDCHANVWPEVLQQIYDCNIRDCQLKLERNLNQNHI